MTDHAAVIREALCLLRGIQRVHVLPADDALAALEQELAEAKAALTELGLFAAGHSDRDGKASLVAALHVIAHESENALTFRGKGLGSGETAAHAADGTGSYPKDRLMLTDSPHYSHRCFTDEGEWVSCPPELCEADFLLREKQAAEADNARLRARLADADEIIDDCWHQFAIDIRGKLSPGGLSTLEMVDDYRNERDGAALGKDTP